MPNFRIMSDLRCYIYAAEVYCEACGRAIRQRLTAAGKAPADPANEHTYDSDVFPKGPYGVDASDTPEHCGSGPKCLDPTEIDGDKVGKFLENDLTEAGVRYVREALDEDPEVSPVVTFWVDFYRKAGYDIPKSEYERGQEGECQS